MVVDEIKMQSQLDSVLIMNENIWQIQRGMNECQHTFEICGCLFTRTGRYNSAPVNHHCAGKRHDGAVSTRRIGSSTFPLPRIFTPYYPYYLLQTNLFSVYTSSTLVTVYHVPIIQNTAFPFQQQGNIFVYIEAKRDYIFADTTRRKYWKLNHQELQACLKPNDLNHVC